MFRHQQKVALTVAALVALAATAAMACNTPVFRYALERWQPDQFGVTVLHRGSLSEEQLQLVAKIEASAANEQAPANVVVRTVDLDGELDEETKSLVERAGNPEQLPWMAVQFPPHTQTNRLAYSGPLDAASTAALVDSPMRREVVKRIVGGDSAVWVLVESGDKQKDDAAEELLKTELAKLEKTLSLPEQEADPLANLFPGDRPVDSPIELRLALSSLRISRDDPRERVFTSMLINSESDLHEFDEPIAVPIFGRGRSYYAVVGKGINAENLRDLNAFLVGACSCQIKSENPGADMLIAAAWDELITDSAIRQRELPDLTGLGSLEVADAAAGDSVVEPAASVTETSGTASPTTTIPLYLPVLLVVLFGVVVAVIGTAVMKSGHASTS